MSTHGPEYKNGGPPAYRPLDERVEILESRADDSEERADAADRAIEERDAKLFVVLGNLMEASQRTEATAKAGLDVATLLAEQFHAMRGTVATTHEDTLAVERGLAAMQTRVASVETKQSESEPQSERPSFADLNAIKEEAAKMTDNAKKSFEQIAEDKAKSAVTVLHLDITKGQLAEVKEEGRYQSRFLSSTKEKVFVGCLFLALTTTGGLIWWLFNALLAAKGIK